MQELDIAGLELALAILAHIAVADELVYHEADVEQADSIGRVDFLQVFRFSLFISL